MFIVWQKVASYSEYLVEVVFFLRIYTHINIYCKFISFFGLFEALIMIICMGSSPEWHFWFCEQTKRTSKNAMLFFSFFSVCSLFVPSFLFPLFMPANTLYLYISFFISVTVICTSSLDALTMQNPFFHSITCTVFSTRHHNCLLPQKEFMGNFEGGQTSTKKQNKKTTRSWLFLVV